MLERVIAGVIIGMVARFVLGDKEFANLQSADIKQIFVGIIAIGFVASSFVFGVIYGVMAIAELAFGYWLYAQLFPSESKRTEDEELR